MCGNAKHKLSQLHYVGENAEAKEAAHVSIRVHHSENLCLWKPSQNQNGHATWWISHTTEGYAIYQQFRNGFYLGLI